MSYINELVQSLVKVISNAGGNVPTAFAGYAANRDFWVDEAAHVLAVIDGYHDRFVKMSQASAEYRPPVPVEWSDTPISFASSNAGDLTKARKQVRDAMRRFLGRCASLFPDTLDVVIDDCSWLGISTPI